MPNNTETELDDKVETEEEEGGTEETAAAEEADEGEPQPETSPNDKVRAATGQPSQQAAAPVSTILTPNQVVRLNMSHAMGTGPGAHLATTTPETTDEEKNPEGANAKATTASKGGERENDGGSETTENENPQSN